MATNENELSPREFKKAVADALAVKAVVIWATDGVPTHVHFGADPEGVLEDFAGSDIKKMFKPFADMGRHISCSFHLVRVDAEPGMPPRMSSFTDGIVIWTMGPQSSPLPKTGDQADKVMDETKAKAKAVTAKKTNGNGKSTAKKVAAKPVAKKVAAKSTAKKTTAKKPSVVKKRTARAAK